MELKLQVGCAKLTLTTQWSVHGSAQDLCNYLGTIVAKTSSG